MSKLAFKINPEHPGIRVIVYKFFKQYVFVVQQRYEVFGIQYWKDMKYCVSKNKISASMKALRELRRLYYYD